MSELTPLLGSLDRVEPWSYPTPHLAEHAQVWHTRRFAAWLLRAGAEARFGALLSSGDKATARWSLLLEEQGVEVLSVTSTLERPLPQPLTLHRGDHFNRKLFLIEGLDALTQSAEPAERESYWRTLDGQRGQLNQRATWVTLLIHDHQTLVDALTWAPRLTGDLARVCWVWEASERRASTAPRPHRRSLPTHQHSYLYELFCAASTSDQELDHHTLGRIFRAGYSRPPRSAHARWQWGYRLWRGEARDPKAARFGQVGVTEQLSDAVSPEDACWALWGRAEAASPARRAQWLERARDARCAWTLDSALSISTSPALRLDDLTALNELRAWSLQHSEASLPSVESLTALEGLSDALINDSMTDSTDDMVSDADEAEAQRLCAVISAWLTQAYAAHEDLEGCSRVNRVVYEEERVWPEVRFVALERALDLALFCQDHAEARRIVERLEGLDQLIGSPHFAARSLHARSKQLGALDPSRGVWESEEAGRLEERFGLLPPKL